MRWASLVEVKTGKADLRTEHLLAVDVRAGQDPPLAIDDVHRWIQQGRVEQHARDLRRHVEIGNQPGVDERGEPGSGRHPR